MLGWEEWERDLGWGAAVWRAGKGKRSEGYRSERSGRLKLSGVVHAAVRLGSGI